MRDTLVSALALCVGSRLRCIASGNTYWEEKHGLEALSLVNTYLPHGAGFDSGCTLDLDASVADKLVFRTSFHHMDEAGMYDGWTEHTVVVTPSFELGFHLRVTGRDRKGIKDHIAECFSSALSSKLNERGMIQA